MLKSEENEKFVLSQIERAFGPKCFWPGELKFVALKQSQVLSIKCVMILMSLVNGSIHPPFSVLC